jgi:protein-L-isoaspartate(D-aspartate) O-methyltransferase
VSNPLERLVEQIDQPLSLAVRQAFLEVDRGWFVPSYYRREGKEWVREETRELVYQDIPLTTKIENGRPVSSSSMPSVMAAMLEALELQPGQNVLEIGTGTGYNAAILSQIVGKSGHIITVESDKEVAQSATERLASRENVHVTIADGFTGYPSQAPYHRILATAAFHQVPQAWREQLAPGGMFVGNLLSSLTSLLIRLQKHEDGSLYGNPIPHGAFFMEMRSPQIEDAKPIDWISYESVSIKAEERESFTLTTLLKDQAFLLSLHSFFPEIQIHRRYNGGPLENATSFETWVIDPQDHTSVTLTTEKIQSRGERLWEQVQQTVFRWEEHNQPALEAYTIMVSPHGEIKISIP